MTKHTNTQNNSTEISEIKQVHSFFLSFYNKKKVKGRPPILKPPDIATITLIQNQYQIKTLKALHNLLKEKYSEMFQLPAYQNFVIAMNKNSLVLLQLIINIISS